MPNLKQTLPRILSSAPSSSQTPLLVQPLEWQTRFPNSFYKITRTKLRTVPVLPPAPKSDKGKSSAQAKGKAPEPAESESPEGEPATRPTGKAWGVLFWNGVPKFPHRTQHPLNPALQSSVLSSPSSPLPTHETYIPQTLIRRALTSSWALLDPSALPPATRELVDGEGAVQIGKGRIDGSWRMREREEVGLGKERKRRVKDRARVRRAEREEREGLEREEEGRRVREEKERLAAEGKS